MKTCTKCHKELGLSEFYRTWRKPREGRGGRWEYFSQCKKCRREYHSNAWANNDKYKDTKQKWIEANRDKRRKVSRRYYERNKEKILKRQKESDWYKNKDWKKHYKNNKKKWSCRSYTMTLVRRGKIERLNVCQACGGDSFIEAHHHSYDDSVNVQWLCRKCHRSLHRKD